METKTEKHITIFWSWQSDSPSSINRNFIESCIEKASREIGKNNTILIKVERDTKSVGGSPAIVDTIFSKIRSCDIFIWDSTLVTFKPKPSPNPNVLIELGYAIAILGHGRIIGIMNDKKSMKYEDFPFDLRHRRWPISYKLVLPNLVIRTLTSLFPIIAKKNQLKNQNISKELIRKIVSAIKLAIDEPKEGVFNNDIDLQVGKMLWDIIDSKWILNWYSWHIDNPQYESRENRDKLRIYLDSAFQPEYSFKRESLIAMHDEFRKVLGAYMQVCAREMVLVDTEMFVATIKEAGSKRWIDDYDEKYRKQCDAMTDALEKVWMAWTMYVDELRKYYPEIVQN